MIKFSIFVEYQDNGNELHVYVIDHVLRLIYAFFKKKFFIRNPILFQLS